MISQTLGLFDSNVGVQKSNNRYTEISHNKIFQESDDKREDIFPVYGE